MSWTHSRCPVVKEVLAFLKRCLIAPALGTCDVKGGCIDASEEVRLHGVISVA